MDVITRGAMDGVVVDAAIKHDLLIDQIQLAGIDRVVAVFDLDSQRSTEAASQTE